MMHTELFRHSIDVILENQAPSGAYLASPNFRSYRFCWLRDGSFIAHAMDRAGECASARRFYRWVAATIQAYAWKVEDVIARLASGRPLADRDFLHTRYTVEGRETYDDASWGNFQYDGYGTWLWSLAEHVDLGGDPALIHELSESVTTTIKYLQAVWKLASFDCWEENPEHIHTYSLGAAYGGIRAARKLVTLGMKGVCLGEIDGLLEEIRTFICRYGTAEGRLVKHLRPPAPDASSLPCLQSGVDASLLALGVPYQVFAPTDAIMQQTLADIESELRRPGGGVYRYRSDTYFGGGEWILLTAWLGWYYAIAGEHEKAHHLLRWVESHANEHLELPEQVSDHLLAPEYFPVWVEKWGNVATPLLWSHAMYLILRQTLNASEP